MSDLPFYLRGSGPNRLTTEVLERFEADNPDIATQVRELKPELRVLDLGLFESFCYWIMGQQISGAVADLLIERLGKHFGKVTPSKVLEEDTETLRGLGLSSSKVGYIKNVADFFIERGNPVLEEMTTEEIRDYYCQIRGVGPWTANMMLIFNLGRLDVAAPKDLVVRKGMKVLYGLDKVPSIKEAEHLAQAWGKHKTVGTILSWAAMGE